MKIKCKCPECGKEFFKLKVHFWRTHTEEGRKFDPNRGYIEGSRQSWNKGLTKETNESLQKMSKTYKQRYHDGLIIQNHSQLSDEAKKKISVAMKKAHAEGRAHNIGECRWNNEPSYPEKFMMKVIANEFQDKEYVRELPLKFDKGCYSIDFAWPHKMKAIEIDGKQHQEDPVVKERDERKDAKLIENGWSFLRVRWKDICNNTQHFISEMKKFIDQDMTREELNELLETYRKSVEENEKKEKELLICPTCGGSKLKTSKNCRKCSNSERMKSYHKRRGHN